MELSRIPVLILAGGRGTRLSAVTEVPKPLIPVAGRPFVTYLLADLHQQGFRRIFLLTGYRADDFEQALRHPTSAAFPACLGELDIRFLVEATPLGTGGALRQALPHVATQALVMNGDSYCEMDYLGLFTRLKAQSAALCLTAVCVEDVRDYGCLSLGEGDRLEGFEEKPASGRGWINAGIYGMTRRFLEHAIPPGPSSLEREILPDWITKEATPVRRASGFFRDIGTPERLQQAEVEFPPPNLLWLE
ncbi:MAG: NTP transferase domain-containing protein [Candidatus Eisenbacteria sp.]|nr:NTP transferase domain-containing protein [Candidatus Eisenbacteria bacterium]